MSRAPKFHRTRELAWIAVVLLALTAPFLAGGQETDNEAYQIAKGRVTYKVYCANCHGEKGLGDGPLADILKVRPADLTRIAERRGGIFPRSEISQIVDGREQVRGHGTSEMPIWGDAFQKTLRPTWKDVTDEERAAAKIDEVVSYVASIQESPD